MFRMNFQDIEIEEKKKVSIPFLRGYYSQFWLMPFEAKLSPLQEQIDLGESIVENSFAKESSIPANKLK